MSKPPNDLIVSALVIVFALLIPIGVVLAWWSGESYWLVLALVGVIVFMAGGG